MNITLEELKKEVDRWTVAFKNVYPEGAGNSKPVEMKALALVKTKVKLLSTKQETQFTSVGVSS